MRPTASPTPAPATRASGRALAAAMNRACECFSVSRAQLVAALPDAALRAEHGNLVAGAPVFLAGSEAQAIADFVHDAGAAMALPEFRRAALAQAGATARHDPGIAGGVLGFDFHLVAGVPQLIEINTNPGGLLINAEIQGALQACCADAARWLPPLPAGPDIRERTFDVFEREWRQAGGRGTPTVAIVDESPAGQYLSPEFRLFQQLFEAKGWRTLIADPEELAYRDGRLWRGDTAISLVYNRLTDFALEQPASAAVRDAYLDRAVVLTPHPRAHALNADKRLLGWLADEARLRELGADPALARRVAERVPPTFPVSAADAGHWWAKRKQYFFKPAAGYGGKAAYAGDKLTRKTFEAILAGGYLAQQVVPAAVRGTHPETRLKYDVRAFVDPADHGVILLAARLYRGQTTNFRTTGGGFAPVVVVGSAQRPPC